MVNHKCVSINRRPAAISKALDEAAGQGPSAHSFRCCKQEGDAGSPFALISTKVAGALDKHCMEWIEGARTELCRTGRGRVLKTAAPGTGFACTRLAVSVTDSERPVAKGNCE